MAEDSAAQAVSLLRKQRHSFMNHLQVISGWLQLQRPDRAAQHIGALAPRLTAESDVLRLVSPENALLVLGLMLEAESYGAQVDWQVCSPLEALSLQTAEVLRSELHMALTAASAAPESERWVTVTLGPGSEAVVHTRPHVGEG